MVYHNWYVRTYELYPWSDCKFELLNFWLPNPQNSNSERRNVKIIQKQLSCGKKKRKKKKILTKILEKWKTNWQVKHKSWTWQIQKKGHWGTLPRHFLKFNNNNTSPLPTFTWVWQISVKQVIDIKIQVLQCALPVV